ncbi:DMT family transporter [Singulisphaera sp. PoT]|uniref:DMT family transporter n=1 Tax=Singulisphaera sp. PoT TaxID=3411797 RepID=UPI003BF49795
MARTTNVGAYVSLALMVLIGSGTAPAAKFAVRELPLGLLPLARFGGAALCLLPIVWRSGALSRMVRSDFRQLALASVFCVPINQFFLLSGARLAPTSHVALIYASCPLFVTFLTAMLGQERFIANRLAGIIISVSGVLVIGLENLFISGATSRDTLWGDLYLVGAVSSWGAYLTFNKPLIARHGAIPALAGTFLLGSLLDVPIALASLPTWPPLLEVSPAAWRGLAYLTVAVSVVGLTFQNVALRRLDASQVATVNNASPILTVLWGIWLFGEAMTPALAVGGALTLGGILWTNRPQSTAQA